MATSRLTTAFKNLDTTLFSGYMLAILTQTITETSDSTIYVGQRWRFPVHNGQVYTDATYATVASLPCTQSGSATPGNVPISIYQEDSTGKLTLYASVIIPPESGGVPVVLASLPTVSPDLTIVGASVTGINFKGSWSGVTAYATNDAVYYQGDTWFANQSSTNQAPALASVYWQLLFQGSVYNVIYDSTIAYSVGDVVVSSGTSWVCTTAGTGHAPAAGSIYWAQNPGPITTLTAAASANSTDEIATNQSHTHAKVTGAQLATMVWGQITTLAAASAANSTDEIPANQAGTQRKITVAQLATEALTIQTTSAAAAATGAEEFPVIQGGADKGMTVRQVLDLAASTPSAAGAVAETYAASLTTPMGVPVQTLALTGNVTSWATSGRLAGLIAVLLLTSAVDGTFTRATTAYDPYTGASVASGVARFPQPGNNRVTYSEDFTNAAWTKSACDVVPNARIAPNLSTNATHLSEDASTAVHNVSQVLLATVGSPGSLSVFLRQDIRSWGVLQIGTGNAWFDLATGAIGTVTAAHTATINYVGDGWYRCTLSTASVAGNGTCYVATGTADTVYNYAGTVGWGIYLWGAQFEHTATATAYNATGTTIPGQGFMVEESDTNLWLYSDQADNAVSTKVACSVTANGSIAPDGTMTMDKIVEDSTNNQRYIYQGALLTVGAPGSVSFVAKAAERPIVYVQFGTSSLAWFNTSTGTVGTLTNAVASIEPLPNGSYLCKAQTVGNVLGNGTVYVGIAAADNTPVYAGDGASGLYVWRIQASTKAYPTSGIQTLGASVARNAESFTVPTSGAITTAAGSVVVEAYVDGDQAAATQQATLHILYDSGVDVSHNRIVLYSAAGTPAKYYAQITTSAGTVQTTPAWPQQLAVGRHRFAISWDSTQLNLDVDGTQRGTLANPTLPNALASSGYIGSALDGTGQWDQSAMSIACFARLLSTAERSAYTNPHDPTVPGRLSQQADYFIDFASVSASNGGNLAPSRQVTVNPAWHVAGTTARTISLYSGKVAQMRLTATGTAESNVFATYYPETA